MSPRTKTYRLKPGKTHRVPNPEYVEGKHDAATESHRLAKEGDLVELTDEQFKSFKDKFIPIGSDASEVRDRDDLELETAKIEAARTGTMVDPNKPQNPTAVAAAIAAGAGNR